jgi:hypothetical protein
MPLIQLYNTHKIGTIKDLPDHKLPPEAWTHVRNMRFGDDKAYRFSGEVSVMSPPSVPPSFLMCVEGSAGIFWLYAEAGGAGSKVYAFNSATHADISKAGDYSVTNFRDWNGTVFHGTPIINPVSDDPQYWAALNLTTDLADLPNWPASTTARLIRTYKNYLVALHITDGDGVHGHRVMWSHRAAAGELPSSWDFTDPTVDAGINELSDVNSGLIQEAMPLRTDLAIYKNDSTWLMRFQGGQDVMGFANVLQTSGILGPRCACPLTLPLDKSQVHFVMNGLDLGVFNGQGFESVVYRRDRRYLLSAIDSINFANSFVFDNPSEGEAWFCYPTSGESVPNEAMVWNYRDNEISFRDFQGSHAASGPVESASATTWANVMGTWDDAEASLWQEGARRKLVIANPTQELLLQADTGITFNEVTYSSILERTGLAVIGTDPRTQQPVVDFEQKKLVKRIWPKIKGGRVQVTVGKCEEFDDIGNPVPDYTDQGDRNTAIYTPGGGTPFVDVMTEGRLIAVKFEGIDGDHWEMDGYDIDVEPLGQF